MWKVSGSGILTGTDPPPHTFAAERPFSLSPCPPLRRIPQSWSAPAAGPSPSSPSRASLWQRGGGKRKRKKDSYLCAQCDSQCSHLSDPLSISFSTSSCRGWAGRGSRMRDNNGEGWSLLTTLYNPLNQHQNEIRWELQSAAPQFYFTAM